MLLCKSRLKLYLIALALLQMFTCAACIPFVRHGFIDFRTFYTAGAMVRSGNGALLYDYASELRFQNAMVALDSRALPMMAPPFTAIPFIPLSLLGFRAAYGVFLGTNLLLLALSATLLWPRLQNLGLRWRPAPWLLFFSFLPAGLAVMMGQLSVALLLIFTLSFLALERKQDLLAGLLLSLALAKFQLALPVALLYMLWRRWAFCAGFGTGILALLTLSARVIGPDHLIPWLHSLVTMSTSVNHEAAFQHQFAIFPLQFANLYGLAFLATTGAHWAPVLAAGASVLLVGWAAVQKPSLPFALLIAILVSFHLFLYDLTLLLLPLSLLAAAMIRDLDPEQPRLTRPAEQAPGGPHHYAEVAPPAALACLLLAPLERFLIGADLICTLALPILVLAVTRAAWPPLPEPTPTPEAATLARDTFPLRSFTTATPPPTRTP